MNQYKSFAKTLLLKFGYTESLRVCNRFIEDFATPLNKRIMPTARARWEEIKQHIEQSVRLQN